MPKVEFKYDVGDFLLIIIEGTPAIRRVEKRTIMPSDHDSRWKANYIFGDCQRLESGCIKLEDAIDEAKAIKLWEHVAKDAKDAYIAAMREYSKLIDVVNSHDNSNKEKIIIASHRYGGDTKVSIKCIRSINNNMINYECLDGTNSSVLIGIVDDILIG